MKDQTEEVKQSFRDSKAERFEPKEDFIGEAVCINCKSYKNGKCEERFNLTPKESGFKEINPEDHCSYFEKSEKSIETPEEKDEILFPTLNVDPYDIVNKYIEKYPIFFDSGRNWWIWKHNEYRWKIVDNTDILSSLNSVTQTPNVTNKTKSELLEAFRQIGRRKRPKDAKISWIQFKDTIYDIETDMKFQANPKYFVTNPIPWELGESEDTPIIDKLFNEWVGEKYVKLLYEIMVYCLIPDYPINRLFCLLGEGSGGKSSFQRLIEKFIGKENVTATELDRLVANPRFEVTRLHKKLLCLIGETDFGSIGRSSVLKRLTGKDKIPMEYKHRGMFEDYNYAKILIATNNLPTTDDKTEGWYRRWCIIDFPNKFDEKEDVISTIPNKEYNNLAFKSIKILKDLIKRGEFTNEGTIEDRKKKYEEKSNPFDKFWNENIEDSDVNGHIFTFDLKKKLNEWCSENRFRTMSERTIARFMKEKGATAGRAYAGWQTGDKRKQLRCWNGISWKDEKKEEVKIEEEIVR